MATANPSIGVIRAQIRAIRNKAPNARVVGIFTRGRWTGRTLDGAGSDEIAIYQCDSPLQMRLALQDAPGTASATVLVTPLDQGEVSDDILVRMALRRLHPINSWEIVRSLFKAKDIDPRVTHHAFLADLLLEHAGNRDFPPVVAGLLDADTVWSILLVERLGLASAHPDLAELLRATAETDLAVRWKACTPEFRSATTAWIGETAGDVANAVLSCVESEHGVEALAIGLVLGIVYHDTVGHDLDKAAGRLEVYVGTANLPTRAAKRWCDAASTAVTQLSRTARRRCLDEAEAIIENIGASSHAWRSNDLESGFEQRLSRFGQALKSHVDSRATAISEELQTLYATVQEHRLWRDAGRRAERVTMAVRLLCWLANQNAGKSGTSTGFPAMAQAYAGGGGFVDWARQVLRGGEPNKDLAAAYMHLVDRITDLREAENLWFGQVLCERQAMGDVAAGLIPVEKIIEQVVAKAAEKAPVLLLVVDGMSWAVFRELVLDIKSHNWIELSMTPAPKRLIGLAALPSTTEVCRTSLLCGALRRGQASDEVQGFATHAALVALSQPSLAPKLFHKAALEGDEDSSLAKGVRQALSDRKHRVVGIVVNAVDDHLDKGDQIDTDWTMQRIRVLEPILAEARAAGRLVVLLSDHGHVLDRQTEAREASDGLRWRRSGGAVAKDELDLDSPRVVMPDGGRIIVPWSERLRYGSRKNGYHGGATPQEMLIPIGVLWSELQAPDGFGELPVELPAWWTEPMVPRPIPVTVEQPRRSKKPEVPSLFDRPRAPQAKAIAEAPWIEALVQSEVFARQKRLIGRVRIDDEMVQRLIVALVSRGGTMTTAAIAGTIGVPEHRLSGLLAIMQRLLNIEGYAILDRQDTANTVVLNISLLKKQFELDS
jgi:hypothetical protein